MNDRVPLRAIFLLVLSCARAPVSVSHADERPLVERGFHLLYQLKFEEARVDFTEWHRANPTDSFGQIAIAASYLFEEFYNQKVLTSEYFLNDARLLKGIEGKPDEDRQKNFLAANRMGRTLALKRLDINPRDTDALLAMAMSAGMQADFAAILKRRQLESLSSIKEAETYAKRLLVLKPEEADAWLSLGAANYIIGCLPLSQRFFLWFGRVRGNKQIGMSQLQITAEKGHYLKPFAEIFLALAALREKQCELAHRLFQDLTVNFPENPLFQAELARLDCHYENSQRVRP